MQLWHFYHQQRLHQLAHSKFWVVEFAIWLHIFARSIIAIFVPILLLEIGYSLGDVMVYYFLFTASNVPLNFLARRFIQNRGARLALMLATAAIIFYFIGFYNLTAGSWPLLILLALLAGLYDALYWVAHIYLFLGSDSSKKNSAKDTSILYIVKQVAGLLGPAVGALILVFAGDRVLIATSIIFFALSLLPLLHLRGLADKPTTKSPPLTKLIQNSQDRRNLASWTLFALHRSAELTLWPLFIYIVFSSIESVAYVPIIISITAMLFSYLIGKITSHGAARLVAIGSLLVAVTWLARIIIPSTELYYLSIFLVGLFSLLVSIPLDSDMFSRSSRANALNLATLRNATSMGAQTILYGILALLINIFHVGFIFAIIGAFAVFAINALAIAKAQHRRELKSLPINL